MRFTAVALSLVFVSTAAAQVGPGPVEGGAVEQSCRSLAGGTAGTPQEVPEEPGAGIPPTVPSSSSALTDISLPRPRSGRSKPGASS